MISGPILTVSNWSFLDLTEVRSAVAFEKNVITPPWQRRVDSALPWKTFENAQFCAENLELQRV